jgi:hypothetical protein
MQWLYTSKPFTTGSAAMSTLPLCLMRSLRLNLRLLVLIAAVLNVSAGLAVLLHQPAKLMPQRDAGTSTMAVAIQEAPARPALQSQGEGWEAASLLLSSSLAARSQLFF